MTIKQFKLTSNEEIICEVIENDDDPSGIIAKRILKVHVGEDYDNGIRYYSFKPWMSFQDHINDFSIITAEHIIGQTTPSESLKKHYCIAIEQVEKEEHLKKTYNLDELISDSGDIDPEELEDFLRSKFEEDERDERLKVFSKDSDTPNVIKFDPKKYLH